MSNSNVGGRKHRNICDHLFIVHGVINSVLNGEGNPIDIQIYDVEKCFDALWLEDCMLDMFDTLPKEDRDDKLALVYKMNMENYVAINTAVGLTDRILIQKIVMQGGKWGPLKCSITMDKIGRRCVVKGEHLYSYKGLVKVMPLAMIDDLLGIANCGTKSADLNIAINAEIEIKKLRFYIPDKAGKSKCHTMHIGKQKQECTPLKVHGTPMEKVNSDTYLGDVLSNDGKNKLNIEARVSKGLGIVSQILDILKCVNFGTHYFEIAATLRESILINGMLTNCEVWYGLTEIEIGQLEEVDRLLLRQVFNVAGSCPIEALYLELGCVPIRQVIKSRRLNYLHHLVTRNKSEMVFKFFMAQWNYPAGKNEWTEQTRSDLEEFGIENSLEWIQAKSKLTFKNLVKKRAKEVAFEWLITKKKGHSKMNNLSYSTLEMQDYLKNKEISTAQAKILFRVRTRMEKFGENFKPCPVCKESMDTQSHSFQCKVISRNILVNGQYEDMFTSKVNKKVAEDIERIVKFREGYQED
jgi:hypothetical protein